MSSVVALDLSLTSTGYAVANGTARTLGTMHSAKLRGVERLMWIRDQIGELLAGLDDIDLILVEDLPHGLRNAAAGPLGELHGVVKVWLHELAVPTVMVPPATVKVIATGKGNADKGAMLAAAIRRLAYDGSDGDEVDALWLLTLGQTHLGCCSVTLPETHRRALDKVAWPQAVAQ